MEIEQLIEGMSYCSAPLVHPAGDVVLRDVRLAAALVFALAEADDEDVEVVLRADLRPAEPMAWMPLGETCDMRRSPGRGN